MIRFATIALAMALGLAACKTTGTAERPPNPGSHHVSWIAGQVLPGRTVILFDKGNYTADWKNWFVTRAVYHLRDDGLRDGGTLSCEGEKRRYREVRFDGSYFAWEGHDLTAAVGNNSGWRAPVFYNVRTGRFHIETWHERTADWYIDADGWLQEGWPRLMADACPELTQEILADGGWINENQTHPTIWKMLEQDPSAPLVLPHMSPNHPTGVAASDDAPWHWCFTTNNRPVLPGNCFPEGEEAAPGDSPALLLPESPDAATKYIERRKLAATLRAAHGHVIEDRLGRSYVLALGPTDELWAVDGEGRLTDVGYLTFDTAAETLDLDWELKDAAANFRYRPGDPLPVADTGRQHPLFALADWLVEEAGDVVLPYMGRQARFHFGEGGVLTARGTEQDFGGRWLVTRGRLVLEVDGIRDRAAYRWDRLASHLEATAGYAG